MRWSSVPVKRINPVKRFVRGAWTVHIHQDLNGKRKVILIHPHGRCASQPIRYDDGTIGYDIEAPRDAQRAVKAAYRWLDKQAANKLHRQQVRRKFSESV